MPASDGVENGQTPAASGVGEDDSLITVPVEPGEEPSFWVGLGASAGGLEALRGFVRNLQPSLSATYIVAQHMAPHHRSMLSEIIGRETDMPVSDVVDGTHPAASAIYIVPPNANCIVVDGCLRLTEPSPGVAAPKPSVDIFLSSLARAKGEKAIGVIFSGTGSDGSDGIRSIREFGGVTIAQDEATAKYASMPVSALETGCVDLVMSPEELGAQFRKIIAQPRDLDQLRSSPVHLDSVSELVHLLLEHTKVNFQHYKTATFQRRVERRMAAVGVSNLDDYVSVAKNSPPEVDALFRDMLISVTSFFRDPDEYEAIESHIQEIVDSKKDSQIRVWVAGTATGEEAYSIAIMFAEAMGGLHEFERTRIQIFATDLDDNAIETARRAYYPESALHEVPPDYIDEYFETAPGGYSVKKSLREKVIFSVHNIASDPPFLNVDLLSCRNLLIYFQSVLQAHVFARFHYSLVDHGVLFLGKSESVSAAENLFRVSGEHKHVFFQRPSAVRAQLRDVVTSHAPTIVPSRASRIDTSYPPPEARQLAVAEAQFESLVRGLGPNAMLLSADLNILRVFGDVGRFVGISEGTVKTTADSLLIEPFRQDVRVVVPSTIRQRTVMQGMARSNPDNPLIHERVVSYPISTGPDDEVLALVIFSQWTEEGIVDDATIADGHASEAIDALRRELAIAQTNLQHTVEELETSNEELQALNEELQSSNEELQSTNEELETSNEELQSTNEELSTVNEELQVNSVQLNVLNQSLQSILDNVAIPMIVVDRSLNITHTSAASEALFGVSPGLVLPHLSRCRLPDGYPDLTATVGRAMRDRSRLDIDVSTATISSHVSVVPHFSAAGEMVGVIILVSDSTAALQKANRQLNAAAQVAGLGHFTVDLASEETHFSDQMRRLLALAESSEPPTAQTLVNHLAKQDRRRFEQLCTQLVETSSSFDEEFELIDSLGDRRVMRITGSPGLDGDDNVVGILGVVLDITDQKEYEARLEATLAELSRSNEELNRFSYVCSHDMKEPVRMIEGLAELMLDPSVKSDPEQQESILNRITVNMARLRRIIDSLLAYSRIEAKVEDNVIDLREVVMEIDDALSLAISEHGAELIVDPLPQLTGARIHFTQLFQNLIGNALKFSDQDEPVVRVSSMEDDRNHIVLRVEDNGPGVPEESREKIFDLFDRLHRQDEIEGVGLGLSICQRIVAQYGGTISCNDSELGGACFEIAIPRGA